MTVVISTGLTRVTEKGAPLAGISSILNGTFTPTLVGSWLFTMNMEPRSA